MAWTWRELSGLFQRLDNEFKTDINLSDALSMPQLLQALNEQSPRVVKYIIKHIKEIIEIAIGKTAPTDPNDEKQCINILTKSPVIKDYFNKTPELFNYLINSFSTDEYNYLPLLNLLQGVIEKSTGSCLSLIRDSSTFFQMLLNLLPISYINSFLLDLFSHPYKNIVKWTVEIEADKHLYPFLFEEEPKMVCALSILNKLVNIFPSKSEPMKRITSKTVLSQIFSAGIDAPTNEAAYAAFRLIVTVCNQCDIEEELSEVIEFLDSKTDQITRYIVNGREFTKDKSALCELLNAVITVNPAVIPQILEMVNYLFDTFFKVRTNSFLHLTFFSIFETISKSDQESFSQFVSSQKVVDRLLEMEEKRETDLMAAFWGFLTKMEIILRETVKDDERFDNFVSEKLVPRQSIIESNYGGEVPKVKVISSDSDQEMINFFGIDLSKLKNLSSSDSESNSEEESEENLVSASDDEDDNGEKTVFVKKSVKSSEKKNDDSDGEIIDHDDEEDEENIDHDDNKNVDNNDLNDGEIIDHDDKDEENIHHDDKDDENSDKNDLNDGENIDHDDKDDDGNDKNDDDDEKIVVVETIDSN